MVDGHGHILVIGGAGFLGSHVCERLLRDGHRVTTVDDLSTGHPDNLAGVRTQPGFRFVELDVTQPVPEWPAEARTAVGLRGETPVTAVLHLASPASPKDYQRLPLETLRAGSRGTEMALDVAHRHSARFLLASTSEVYGDPLEHPQRETYWGNVNPVGPRSVYDEAKRYAEALTTAYARELGTNVAIARIFNTYGPRMRADDGRMIPTFITQALRGAPLTVAGTGEQTRSVCYVDDTVSGLLALLWSGVRGPVNIGNPHELSVRDVADRIRDLTGSSSDFISVPAAVDDPRRRCPDITVARAELGWCPEVGPRDGLRRTIAWFAARTGASPRRAAQ